jgi:hypothetical protein
MERIVRQKAQLETSRDRLKKELLAEQRAHADIERNVNNGEIPNPMVILNKKNGLVYVLFLTYVWRILMFTVAILQSTVPRCVGCCLIRSLPFDATCVRSTRVQVSEHSRSAEPMLILSSPFGRPQRKD